MSPWILLPLAGGLGAYLRYRADLALQKRLKKRGLLDPAPGASVLRRSVPAWPILVINMIGSFVAGVLVGNLSADAWLVVGTGLLVGWTTFSTAMVDALQLITKAPDHSRGVSAALIVGVGGMLLTVLCALAGLAIGSVS